jgi:hypothetical protein
MKPAVLVESCEQDTSKLQSRALHSTDPWWDRACAQSILVGALLPSMVSVSVQCNVLAAMSQASLCALGSYGLGCVVMAPDAS